MRRLKPSAVSSASGVDIDEAEFDRPEFRGENQVGHHALGKHGAAGAKQDDLTCLHRSHSSLEVGPDGRCSQCLGRDIEFRYTLCYLAIQASELPISAGGQVGVDGIFHLGRGVVRTGD